MIVQLLERVAALAALTGYAREARQGDGRLVLVAGEAGIGKSALVEQLHEDLPDARWLWGACDGLFTPRPLGPLFDLAGQLGGELEELCRAGAAREELFRALLGQVREAGTLSVLVVEDVHWADEATVDLLRFLGRRVWAVPVLLIATYRGEDTAAGAPLRVALGEIARQRSTRRVDLGPLSAEAVRVLAGGTGLDAAELYRLTAREPVLCHRGGGGGAGCGAGIGARRGAGAGGAAGHRVAGGAGCGGADRRPGGAGAAGVGHGVPAGRGG